MPVLTLLPFPETQKSTTSESLAINSQVQYEEVSSTIALENLVYKWGQAASIQVLIKMWVNYSVLVYN